MDAKVEVDSELADVSSTNQVKSVLADAMDAYIVARDFLGKCLRDGDKYGLTFFDSEEQKRYKRYGLEFYENHAVKDRVAMIWEYASKKIAEAELMLHR